MISAHFEAILARSGQTPCNIPVQVELKYDTADPLAFSMVFSAQGGEANPWVAARDLLVEAMGCFTPTGEGDVRLRQDPLAGHLLVCVKSPTGHADVKLPLQPVAAFLEESQLDADIAEGSVEGLVDDAIRGILGDS